VLADGELRAAVWGTQTEGPPANTIAVHVGRLRNRLQGVVRIRRIRGRGYSLTLP
jgi:two-component system, OmpR family, response regulator